VNQVTISVVIPTLNEEAFIGRCIEAIKSGTVQPDELFVIDGMSEDRTRDIAAEAGATVLLNPERHAAGGRNIGISHSSGDVVVFIDADCIAYTDWLEIIAARFCEQTDLDGLSGKMVPIEPRSRIESFWSHVMLQEILPYPAELCYIETRTMSGAFITANCAYRRKLLLELNGFDVWFANNAEDVDLLWRALEHGARLQYDPDVVVLHTFPDTLKGMMKKNFRNGVSSSKLQKRYGNWYNIDKYLYKTLGRHIIGVVRRDHEASLYCLQLSSHLMGKYWGSLKYGIINI
jgi:glycosyltransferase involved in cell wall biosynthesis